MKIDKTMLGKRILWKKLWSWRDINDGRVIEISPSGEYVKIDEVWHSIREVNVIEELE